MQLFLHVPLLGAIWLRFVCLLCLSEARYVLVDDYEPSAFFDMFEFFNETDPTNGHVYYVDQKVAREQGFTINTTSSVYIGTDHTSITPEGRPSVRLTSKKFYNPGTLIVLDLAHMPGGICSTWPAFWTVGPQWPNAGEIDILEGSNQDDQNTMTLHTSDGCSIADADMSGSISTYDCYIDADGQSKNEGCSVKSSQSSSYGTFFNIGGGGVYAMEWTTNFIRIWFFPRTQIPQDILQGAPNPTGWGNPTARFGGNCDIAKHFWSNKIVFDLTFCGDLAGNTWSTSGCSTLADTCESFVSNNPAAFQDAYWLINSLRTYEQNRDDNRTSNSARYPSLKVTGS